MKRGWGKKQIGIQPDGKARTSQVVTTFGPGAMMDLIDHAVLVGGLEFWQYDKARGVPVIQEPRLRDAVAERLAAAEREIGVEDAFREPPAGDDKQASKFRGIQVLEFPQWFVCQNPDCRRLSRSKELEIKGGRYRHACTRAKETECVPVRFVAACPRGHLEEFPWVSFAHRSQETRCPSPILSLREGATGDFSEIVVVCECGAREPLSKAQVTESNPHCAGKRPWLGDDATEGDCDQNLRLLVRTASNSYFAQVMSALSIPEHGRELENSVRQIWDVLASATDQTLPAFRSIPKVKAAVGAFDDASVLAVVEALRDGRAVARAPIRSAEYQQFMAQKEERPGELAGARDTFFARSCEPARRGLPGIGRVVLAHKLREVRVQIGFTRLEPVSADLQGEYDLQVRSAPLSQVARWLPASEVNGEGLFIALDEKAVQSWETRREVQTREKELLAGFGAWAQQFEHRPEFPGARFYLLHSLAHLVISAISLECGYAASALRERIYCAPAHAPLPMAAILLSTGTPGSEGTLGGLVEQGKNLRAHLRRAYELGLLCSHDPVCGAHSPDGDPAERHLEGAACHGCLFVAECSCERFNRYLDRALVVPTMGHPAELAFFRERP